jgi:hypothetical protein
MKHPPHARLAAGAILALAPLAAAQEAMYTEAATMPSPGVFVLREQVHFFQFGTNYDAGTRQTQYVESETGLSYGLARDWAVTFNIPVQFRWTESLSTGNTDYDKGVEDLDLMLKYRFYKDDSGGIDTARAALFGGASFASGDDSDFSSGSINPFIGVVLTIVKGRHGFDFDTSFKWNTGGDPDDNFGGDGPSDAFRYNAAYLYRIDPPLYTSTTKGAWYVTAELNGLYETNGDNEIRFSPGLMYEGRRLALEFMAQLPFIENVRHRAELDFAIGMGVRLTF